MPNQSAFQFAINAVQEYCGGIVQCFTQRDYHKTGSSGSDLTKLQCSHRFDLNINILCEPSS